MKAVTVNKKVSGFSLVELIVGMTIMLIILGVVSTLFAQALSTRQRESSRADALTAAQAALNVISREVANSGYGLIDNGIIAADSGLQKLHFISNTTNTNAAVTDQGEDITYFFDTASKSILRYDAHGNPDGSAQTSIIINRISDVKFQYFNYSGSSSTATETLTPSNNTGRITVTITVNLENVSGQTNGQKVVLISDVTLRNSDYMLQQY
jgi:prepilin-type N-terminal cleavage/methylation domain-containing protein